MHQSTQNSYSLWETVIEINNLTIKGHSRGSEKTGFYIPQLKLFFDAGIQSYFEPKHIFITHSHTDHSYALPMLLTNINSNPSVYVPFEDLDKFTNFVEATNNLSRGSISKRSLVPVKKDDIIDIKTGFMVKVYDMDHSVPCRGYGLIKLTKKLKQEYTGLSRTEIVNLKKNNVEIFGK